jgi:hypothetical protein
MRSPQEQEEFLERDRFEHKRSPIILDRLTISRWSDRAGFGFLVLGGILLGPGIFSSVAQQGELGGVGAAAAEGFNFLAGWGCVFLGALLFTFGSSTIPIMA